MRICEVTPPSNSCLKMRLRFYCGRIFERKKLDTGKSTKSLQRAIIALEGVTEFWGGRCSLLGPDENLW